MSDYRTRACERSTAWLEPGIDGMALGILYMVLTVGAGMFFYWLRNHHRILYGMSEILAALL